MQALWRTTASRRHCVSVNGIARGAHYLSLRQPCPCGWAPTSGSPPAFASSATRTHCVWQCSLVQARGLRAEFAVPETQRVLPGVDACTFTDEQADESRKLSRRSTISTIARAAGWGPPAWHCIDAWASTVTSLYNISGLGSGNLGSSGQRNSFLTSVNNTGKGTA